jgi:hypothetical protein
LRFGNFQADTSEERSGGFLALETVPVPPEQGEEVPEQGDRRQHAGVVAEHDEAHQDAPPVGRDLARREAEVEERVREEGLKREPQTGLQRVGVPADGPWSPAGPVVYSFGTPCFSHMASTSGWVHRDELK